MVLAEPVAVIVEEAVEAAVPEDVVPTTTVLPVVEVLPVAVAEPRVPVQEKPVGQHATWDEESSWHT